MLLISNLSIPISMISNINIAIEIISVVLVVGGGSKIRGLQKRCVLVVVLSFFQGETREGNVAMGVLGFVLARQEKDVVVFVLVIRLLHQPVCETKILKNCSQTI